MKTKTTMKWIRNNFSCRWFVEYAELQNIFHSREADYYNAGVYGWNCDVYVDYATDTAISTGYRNMAGCRVPDEILEKYDQKAQEILRKQDDILQNIFSNKCRTIEDQAQSLGYLHSNIRKELEQNAQDFINALRAIS